MVWRGYGGGTLVLGRWADSLPSRADSLHSGRVPELLSGRRAEVHRAWLGVGAGVGVGVELGWGLGLGLGLGLGSQG